MHALLQHLNSRGFDGAPKLLGLDEQGREILSFVSGSVVWPDHAALMQTDAVLNEIAALIRRYHDAVADFASEQFRTSALTRRVGSDRLLSRTKQARCRVPMARQEQAGP